MRTPYTLTLFTPAEVGEITGVSNNVQRDWRRHGYLPATEGHARFDVFGLCKLLSIRILSERGIGPKDTHEVADWAATGIAFHCFSRREAYEGNHELALTWCPEPMLEQFRRRSVERLETLPAEVKTLMKEKLEHARLLTEGSLWGAQADWLSKQIIQRFRGRVVPAEYLIWWADGSHIFHRSVDAAVNEMTSDDPRVTGPIVFLDLCALAGIVIDKIAEKGRSLVHVEFDVEPGSGKALSPMEYGAAITTNSVD